MEFVAKAYAVSVVSVLPGLECRFKCMSLLLFIKFFRNSLPEMFKVIPWVALEILIVRRESVVFFTE
ncbi:hypothetical protein DT385_25605 [Pseudomonas syringae]|nr:hypothetical protein DT385_25605 [Pseudomonas syringae]